MELGTIADVARITVTGCEDGGVVNYGELHLSDSTVSDNTGTGIYNAGSIFLTDVTISGNLGDDIDGAGILNADGNSTAILQNVNIIDNQSFGSGGGICNRGIMSLTDVNISRNVSDSGGGIWTEDQI